MGEGIAGRVQGSGLREERFGSRGQGLGWLLCFVGLVLCGIGWGQEIQLGEGPALQVTRQYVSLVTEAVAVKAGQPAWVEVRFRVAPGFHINSHQPHDALLIPTGLEVTPEPGVKVLEETYSEGVPLRLDAGAGEVLSTYQGEFSIRVRVVARKGDAVLAGVLRYQACNARSCFPPRNLPVRVAAHAE